MEEKLTKLEKELKEQEERKKAANSKQEAEQNGALNLLKHKNIN